MMIDPKILKFVAGFLAIVALMAAVSCEPTEHVDVSPTVTPVVPVANKVVTEYVPLASTESQTAQTSDGDVTTTTTKTNPKPPMVQYIEEVFIGVQNILGNVAEIVKSSFGSIGRQHDSASAPRKE